MTFERPDATDHAVQALLDQALADGIIEVVGVSAAGQPVYRGCGQAVWTRGVEARPMGDVRAQHVGSSRGERD